MSVDVDAAATRRRAEIGGRGLRRLVAGGTIVNSVYLVSLNALTLVQGLLVARLLGAGQYGLWGLLTITFGTLLALAAVGVDDKYIQQDHPDQRVAFELAFTLTCIVCAFFTVLGLIAVPLFSVLYAQPRILVPGLLLCAAFPLIALQTPVWIFYRRLDFLRQRLLQSVSPIVTMVVTLTLAFLGLGFWALVIGTLAGSVAASVVAVTCSPYALRFRYEHGAAREYATFSWPLLVGSLTGVIAFQVPITLGARLYGAAAVGAVTLASQATQYTSRVDDIVTHALYPAICAVQDRRDLLMEAFSKSNRLALLWGFPVGLGAALFARPGVDLVLGQRWRLAIPLIVVLGLAGAVDQIGFNWGAFARARGETRVLAVGSAAFFVAMLVVGVPLLITDGLTGLAIGIGAGTLANLVVRINYLGGLFPDLPMLRHVLRACAPSVLAGATILALRAVESGSSTTVRIGAEAVVFIGVTLELSWITEGHLLREAAGYVRRAASGKGARPTAPVNIST